MGQNIWNTSFGILSVARRSSNIKLVNALLSQLTEMCYKNPNWNKHLLVVVGLYKFFSVEEKHRHFYSEIHVFYKRSGTTKIPNNYTVQNC